MVETKTPSQARSDSGTQFGNARQLDPSDSIFVFKDTFSDYEEPPSDNDEVNYTMSYLFHVVENLFLPRVNDCKSVFLRNPKTLD